MSIEDTAKERLGPYRLLGQLGEGGMGVVYRGVDESGEAVAVKLIKPEIAHDAMFRRRLTREVETMRRISSRHVARIIDADLEAERPYIVTEYVAGHALDDTVRATGPLSGRLLGQVAAGLAEALVAIHNAGVVHRDLKPNNVMLVNGEPVVIDFGIAHAADATRLTQTGMVVGTPGYMAPEVIDGRAPGPEVDVYAWAATVAFAATGRSPFGTGSMEAVVARIISGRYDLTGLPNDLGGGVQAALARDPARRPTAVQLVGWLRQLRPDGSLPVAGPSHAVPMSPAPMSPPTPAPTSPAPMSPVSPVSPHPAAGRRVDLGWYKLIAYLVIAAAAGATAVFPVLAGFMVVLAAWYLRAGDAAVRSVRVPVRGARDLLLAPLRLPGSMARSAVLTALSVLYAGLFSGILLVVLIVVGLLSGDGGSGDGLATGSLDNAAVFSLTAGVLAYLTLAGLGLMGPRRQLVRLLSAAARQPRVAAFTGLGVGFAAVILLAAAWAAGPRWAPLTAPDSMVDRLREVLQTVVDRISP